MIYSTQPNQNPRETPTIAPTKPSTSPGQDPSKIQNPKPSVDPNPKA